MQNTELVSLQKEYKSHSYTFAVDVCFSLVMIIVCLTELLHLYNVTMPI